MSTIKRKCEVIMIEVSQNSVRPLLVNPSTGKMEIPKHEYGYSAKEYQDAGYKTYQLYFVTHDKVEEGDYYLDTLIPNNSRIRIKNDKGRVVKNSPSYYESKFVKKIVASTDDSLGLSKPTQKFIEKFVSKYNKGNIIDEVMIDFMFEKLYVLADKIKTNSKKEIAISRIKDTWTMDELPIDILQNMIKYCEEQQIYDKLGRHNDFYYKAKKWVENNL
jgi:hypothetical protein